MNYSPDPDLRLNRTMLWLLAVASIPIGVFGLLFEKQAETTLRNPIIIGTMLIAVGLVMWYADKIGRRKRGVGSIGLMDAVTIGVSQALAIVPGTSRSGVTITRGPLPRPRPLLGRPILVPALHSGDYGRSRRKGAYDLYKHGGIPPDMRRVSSSELSSAQSRVALSSPSFSDSCERTPCESSSPTELPSESWSSYLRFSFARNAVGYNGEALASFVR